jgi:hypothetical protein
MSRFDFARTRDALVGPALRTEDPTLALNQCRRTGAAATRRRMEVNMSRIDVTQEIATRLPGREWED